MKSIVFNYVFILLCLYFLKGNTLGANFSFFLWIKHKSSYWKWYKSREKFETNWWKRMLITTKEYRMLRELADGVKYIDLGSCRCLDCRKQFCKCKNRLEGKFKDCKDIIQTFRKD